MSGSRACKSKQNGLRCIGHGRNGIRGEDRERFHLRQSFTFGDLGGDRRTNQDTFRVVPKQTWRTVRNRYLLRCFKDAIADTSQLLLLLAHDAQACLVSSPLGKGRHTGTEVVDSPLGSILRRGVLNYSIRNGRRRWLPVMLLHTVPLSGLFLHPIVSLFGRAECFTGARAHFRSPLAREVVAPVSAVNMGDPWIYVLAGET